MTVAQTNLTKTISKQKNVLPMDITVLAGGPGVEREVSLKSGQCVYESLQRLGHRVTLCDINPGDVTALDLPADFVFIALHGEFGEDGTVQQLLDDKGIPFAGTGAAASRLTMNKVDTKQCLENAGLKTPAYEVVSANNISNLSSTMSPPVVVKPVASGSSVDTSIEHDIDHMLAAVQKLIEKQDTALVEQYIKGPELTVGILGDQALPVCEIRTSREFYDYQAKYIDDDTQYLFDLDLPAAFLAQIQTMSVQAHRALGCRAFSRVDWMVDGDTLTPYILEINTIPGFTSHSLLPKAAGRIGINFDQLCNRIIDLSLNSPKQ